MIALLGTAIKGEQLLYSMPFQNQDHSGLGKMQRAREKGQVLAASSPPPTNLWKHSETQGLGETALWSGSGPQAASWSSLL